MTANSKGSFGFLCVFGAWKSESDHFFPPLQQATFRDIIEDFTTVSAKAHSTLCFRGVKAILYFLF